MRTYFDCIPCFVRQALDAARLVTPDETIHERVLRETAAAISKMDLRQSPPAMGRDIHRLIRRLTGREDPYRELKDRFNKLALELLPAARAKVHAAQEPLKTAAALAIAGNVIDFGVNSHLEDRLLHEALEAAASEPLAGDIQELAEAADRARDILYLPDNAGEIVFDRLLIEQLPPGRVTVAVKGRPVLNDATRSDAAVAGLNELAEVIDNGSDAPGTLLADCSHSFRERFDRADLVIAKGQGNYETLSNARKDIFFLLKAKCPVIARHLGCDVGRTVVQRSRPAAMGGRDN